MIERTSPLPEPVNRAIKWLTKDRSEDTSRDLQCQKLINAYDGYLFDLEKGGNRRTTNILSPDLLDITGDRDQGGQQYYEISANLAFPLVEDWKSVIGIQPVVTVPSSDPGNPEADTSANKRENIITGNYSVSDMDIQTIEGAHYQSLLGSQIYYLRPDHDNKKINIRGASPYGCHARTYLGSTSELHHLAFDVVAEREMILEDYPQLERLISKDKSEVRVTEWYDREYRMVLVEDTWIDGLPYTKHGWGFVPGVIIPNIVGTGSLWGRSDIRQIVHIAQILSEVISMQHDALFDAVHDQLLIFSDKPVTQFAVGPHEATQFEKDAKVQMMHQGVQMPDVSGSQAILERLARLIGGWPEVMSSEMDSSIVTGKAFTAAQGPVSARAALKHRVIASRMQRLNSMMLYLYEKEFPNDEIILDGITGGTHTSLFPSGANKKLPETIKFIPSRDIAGQYANFLTFPASGSDSYRDMIQWLQLKEAQVISGAFIRENTPGIDPDTESKRVAREFMEKAQQTAQANQMMQQAMQPQQQAMPVAPGGEQAQPAGAEAQAQMAPGPQEQIAQGQAAAPSPGMPQTQEQPASPATGGQVVKLSDARKVFAAVNHIRGEVFIGGALASTGTTNGNIDVYISDPQDKGTIISQTIYGRQGRLLFHKLTVGADGQAALPDEPVINVTPRNQEPVASAAPQEQEAVV